MFLHHSHSSFSEKFAWVHGSSVGYACTRAHKLMPMGTSDQFSCSLHTPPITLNEHQNAQRSNLRQSTDAVWYVYNHLHSNTTEKDIWSLSFRIILNKKNRKFQPYSSGVKCRVFVSNSLPYHPPHHHRSSSQPPFSTLRLYTSIYINILYIHRLTLANF